MRLKLGRKNDYKFQFSMIFALLRLRSGCKTGYKFQFSMRFVLIRLKFSYTTGHKFQHTSSISMRFISMRTEICWSGQASEMLMFVLACDFGPYSLRASRSKITDLHTFEDFSLTHLALRHYSR